LATEASGQILNSLDGETVFVCLKGDFSLHASVTPSNIREEVAMAMQPSAIGLRFVRRTALNQNEYRTNFRQIDCDVIGTLISDEASRITPLMSKIYLAVINASSDYWEREGVVRITGREIEGEWQTAWEQLLELLGVASATARKALDWMNGQGIIGYHAGKNGVGIRIFINRAASSVGRKPDQDQKNLRLIPTSSADPRTSPAEVPFKESFAVLENLDPDFIPHAPKNGAAEINTNSECSVQKPTPTIEHHPRPTPQGVADHVSANVILSAEVVDRIAQEIVPKVKAAAAREGERTREWFISHALPKAIRVAQASAYDVLRAHGAIKGSPLRGGGERGGRKSPDNRHVGKHTPAKVAPRLLSDEEVTELAEICVTLLLIQGQTIEGTLSGMGVEAGGFLLPEDAPKVRAKAEVLARVGATAEKGGREGNV
jgi:hypothetical protein